MGKQEIKIVPNENKANNQATGENDEAEEKLSFWKHPLKWGKDFNERHPRVKWIVGGVAAAGAAVVAWALAGGKKDDEETYEYEDDSSEDSVDEDSEE